MSFNESETNYSSLPGNEKMLWRLKEAAEVIAFTGASVVPPGDEPVEFSERETTDTSPPFKTEAAVAAQESVSISSSGKAGAAYALASKRALAEADWEQIRRKALAHARQIEFANSWLLPNSVAEDVVHNAIQKVLDGTRRWKPERAGLDHFVVSVVRSEYENLNRQFKNDSRRSIDEGRDLPDESMPAAEEAVELKRMLAGALAQLQAQSPDLFEAFQEFEKLGLFDGRPARLVASDLGISTKELMMRRRKIISFTKEQHQRIEDKRVGTKGKP